MARATGRKANFSPAPAQTKHGGNIRQKYFMQSDACQRCHADNLQTVDSFPPPFFFFSNNQWYRKKHRVHAGSSRAVKSSNGAPVPRIAACSTAAVRYADQTDCGPSGSPRGSRMPDVPQHRGK